jgi:hypothetical protein
MVAGAVLTEASRQGIIDFSVNELGIIDAIEALNKVAVFADKHGDEALKAKMAFIKQAYQTEGVHDHFTFGIEAKLEEGAVHIWWVDF